jgi:formylglycine-generating enzyme required for sulfatase activity
LSDHLADDQWHEALLLAVGFMGIYSQEETDRLVRMIAGLGETEEQRAQALALAGMAIGDLPRERPMPATVQKLREDILAMYRLDPPRVSLPVRRSLGLALGAVGDVRFETVELVSPPPPGKWIGAQPLLGGLAVLPPLAAVGAGEFRMGTSQGDKDRLEGQGVKPLGDEEPDHPVYLDEFQIGRFPVTNWEFRAFWENGGYQESSCWSQDGWRWRSGDWQSDLSVYPEELRKDIQAWLERRPPARRNQPFFWDDPQWNAPNLPVVGVCWFEAQAYCQWLSLQTGMRFLLPSEAQWEKAARGAQAHLWPWGDEWDAEKCNSFEGENALKTTNPVGLYPHGGSPYGALDMVGNVREWCADWYAADEYQNRAGKAARNPSGPQAGQARVARGGSWIYFRNYARCACRYGSLPDNFYSGLGFRVMLSPNPSFESLDSAS